MAPDLVKGSIFKGALELVCELTRVAQKWSIVVYMHAIAYSAATEISRIH